MSQFKSTEAFLGLDSEKIRQAKDLNGLKSAVLEWSRNEAKKLNQQRMNLERTGAGSQNITINVVPGSGTTSSSGSTGSLDYRADSATITAGTVIVAFSTPFPTSDYQIICLVKDNSGIWTQIFDDSITKTANQFSFVSNDSGVVVYFAFLNQ